MPNRFFSRLLRTWWLMLVIGVIIGLAAGLPVGSKILTEELAGAAIENYEHTMKSGEEITVGVTGARVSYDDSFFTLVTVDSRGRHVFRATNTGKTRIIIDYPQGWAACARAIYNITINP